MAVIKQLDKIKNWLETEICPQFKFKQADNENVDDTYPYKLVNPSIFLLYVPPKELIGEATRAPAICIQFDEVQENLMNASGILNIRLQFSVFNPGKHFKGDFKRDTEGWRDLWNFIDHIMERLRNVELIDDIRIIKENGIKCGPISDQGQIPNFYPYYFAWMNFSIEYGIPTSKAQIRNLL